jgi:hypothetical protein
LTVIDLPSPLGFERKPGAVAMLAGHVSTSACPSTPASFRGGSVLVTPDCAQRADRVPDKIGASGEFSLVAAVTSN